MERPKNYVPKEMEGMFTLEVKNNAIILARYGERELKMFGNRPINNPIKQVFVKCSPEDEFDIGEGIKIAMQRLLKDDEIRVGDTVKIVNPGIGNATMPYGFFKDVPLEYAVNFRYGVVSESDEVGKVVQFLSDNTVLVQVDFGHYEGNEEFSTLLCEKPVYCLHTGGLKKIKDGRFE